MIHLALFRRRADPGRGGVGLAVRREWHTPEHEFVHFGLSLVQMDRFIHADTSYWRRAPIRPTRYRVVEISAHDFDLHRGRRPCRSPDCPVVLDAAAADRWVRA